MRILHLTTEFPWPATSGGMVRTVSQLRILASLPEVEAITTLAVAEHRVGDADRRAFAQAVPKLCVLPPVFHPVHLFDFKSYVPRVAALRILGGVPYLAGKWDSPTMRKRVRSELIESAAKVVYIDHLGMARYLSDIQATRPLSRVVLDQHNVESDFFAQLASRVTGARRLAARAEHRASVRFERRALQAVDSVIAISEEDARRFDALAGVRAHVVPVAYEPERRARPPSLRPHFCYVGNLRWRPNIAGLDWLCQEVWPRIRARVQDATLEIAGVGLEREARGRLCVPDAWRVSGVETSGFLDDLEPLYARSLAMLAPVHGGSGVRIKLLEGFCAGIPVVTTPDGAAGLPIEDGKEALVASDPEALAERVERLVRDAALRNRLRDAGYAYLDEHHSVAVAQDAMRKALGLARG